MVELIAASPFARIASLTSRSNASPIQKQHNDRIWTFYKFVARASIRNALRVTSRPCFQNNVPLAVIAKTQAAIANNALWPSFVGNNAQQGRLWIKSQMWPGASFWQRLFTGLWDDYYCDVMVAMPIIDPRTTCSRMSSNAFALHLYLINSGSIVSW
jgi:hypothetical protein